MGLELLEERAEPGGIRFLAQNIFVWPGMENQNIWIGFYHAG